MSNFEADRYRQQWESNEHWQVKKKFLEAYCDDFEEDRLLCLAQMYSNVELLHCRYSDVGMKQIKEFSKNLEGNTHKKRKMPVEFVKAEENTIDQISSTLKINATVLKKSSKRKNLSTHSHLETSGKNKLCAKLPMSIIEGCTQQLPSVRSEINLGSSVVKINATAPKKLSKRKKLSACPHLETSIDNKLCPELLISINEGSVRSKIEDSTACQAGTLDIVSMASSITYLASIGKDIHAHTNSCDSSILLKISQSLKRFSAEPIYNFESIPNKLGEKPLFKCDFYIKNFLISSATGFSKKKAQRACAKVALENFKTLTDTSKNINQSNLLNDSKDAIPANLNFGDNSVNGLKSDNSEKHYIVSESMELSKKRLLDKGLPKKFAIILHGDEAINNPKDVLHKSSALCHIPVTYKDETEAFILKRVSVMIDEEICGTAVDATLREAKTTAASLALKFLATFVFTIKIKDATIEKGKESFVVLRDHLLHTSDAPKSLPDNNIGCKMLKMMGWDGGSIGKVGSSGILEPIKVDNPDRFRRGLGFEISSKDIKSRATALIRDYAKSATFDDLIFSSDFSKEERKELHSIALRFNLKSSSKGKGEKRHIILSRRFLVPWLLQHLMEDGDNSDLTSKFELISPHSLI